jgi:hypothetical protein
MKEEDLIRKLENISLPEIEGLSHKRNLREFLLSQYKKEKKSWQFWSYFWKIVPIGATFAILILAAISLYSRQNNYDVTLAKEIAFQDSRVKSLIEQGAVVKDAQVLDSKAYVLVQLPQTTKEAPADLKFLEEQNTESLLQATAILAEVNFKDKKVSHIENVQQNFVPLTDFEKEKVLEIAKESSKVKNNVPAEAQVQEIAKPSPRLRLLKTDGSVKVVPENEEEAIIIYKKNGNIWKAKVNMDAEELESLEYIKE